MAVMVPVGESSSSVTSSPLQFFALMSLPPGYVAPYPWLRDLKSEERGLCLIQLLLYCTTHVASGSIENANVALDHISHLASPDGDTMQRIAAYFSEALADRVLKSWPGLHKALNSTKISSISEKILVQRLFFELCPFLKLAYVITNQSILESMEGEKMVHIVDLYSFEPAQWINLLQAFSTRPEGPPHLRITGIHEQKEILENMALRLTEEAEKLDVPFQFHPVTSKLENLDIETLRVKTGEALAISSVLQLHSLLASDAILLQRDSDHSGSPKPDSASTSSTLCSIGSFLTALWALSPKLMVITEQESNNNGHTLMERVTESLYFYAALFDCLESTVPRASIERKKVEKILFGEEIKNITACEGGQRKERHEKLEKWIPRLELAGFGRVPFSSLVMVQAGRLLQMSYTYDNYRIKEENGCLLICWQDRPLYSASAWRHRRVSSEELLRSEQTEFREAFELPRVAHKWESIRCPVLLGNSNCSD